LASCKRLTELRHVSGPENRPLPGRAYSKSDLSTITSIASASGYVAVLVMALYLNSPEVSVLYSKPQILWCVCPLLAYWVSRILIIANRGHMDDDPVVFACRDRVSYILGCLTLLTIIAAL